MTVQFIAKNTVTRPSTVTKQLEKRCVSQIGMEKIAQHTARAKMIPPEISIVMKPLV